MIRFLAHTLPPASPVGELSLFLSLPVCRRSLLLTGEGEEEEGGRGATSYDREKDIESYSIPYTPASKVMGSIPASSDTVQPEGRQTKQC
jgi:hypothetical protein